MHLLIEKMGKETQVKNPPMHKRYFRCWVFSFWHNQFIWISDVNVWSIFKGILKPIKQTSV